MIWAIDGYGKGSFYSETEPRLFLFERVFFLCVIVLSFTPFFSPYPLYTDVQPAFIIPLSILFFTTKMQRFNLLEIVFLGLAILAVFYLDTSDPYFSIRKSFGLLIAFATYHFYRVYVSHINSGILVLVVFVNFFAVVFHYLFPHVFAATLGQFVRTIKILSMEGARGASGFAAEPGFTGGVSVFYLSVALFLKEFKGDDRYFWVVVFLSISMIALSKSGTGGLLLLCFVSIMFFRPKWTYIFSGLFLVVVLYVLANQVDLGRAGYAVRMLFENPKYLFLVDSSVGQRVINILIGLISIYEFPLGAGAGSFDRVAEFIVDKYDLSSFVAGNVGNISAFAKYSVELGVFFWLFLVFCVIKALAFSGSRTLKYLFIALFYISASFSIVFPPIWFIFAAIHSVNHRDHGGGGSANTCN